MRAQCNPSGHGSLLYNHAPGFRNPDGTKQLDPGVSRGLRPEAWLQLTYSSVVALVAKAAPGKEKRTPGVQMTAAVEVGEHVTATPCMPGNQSAQFLGAACRISGRLGNTICPRDPWSGLFMPNGGHGVQKHSSVWGNGTSVAAYGRTMECSLWVTKTRWYDHTGRLTEIKPRSSSKRR